jgi:anti-sigma B factor antagonist
VSLTADFRSSIDVQHARLTVVGELDVSTCAELTDRLERLAAEPIDVLLLDVRRVSFVDASCLRELELTRRRLLAEGRRLQLVAASRRFLLVARLAGFRELASVEPARAPEIRGS